MTTFSAMSGRPRASTSTAVRRSLTGSLETAQAADAVPEAFHSLEG